MRFVDIIEKKRWGQSLDDAEIRFWIEKYTAGEIPDYQVSALLMAIVFNGMDTRETATLTMAMMESGDVIDLSDIPGVKVDKHSTGGVGDKTTLALGPMLAANGAIVAKMSGRGLGATGGTLDKLESIAGYNCYPDADAFKEQLKHCGIALIGQSADLVPADKKLYALRDVTGTVSSIPLIAASIMSKKLAAGAEVIELDVKYGNGAFMKTAGDAQVLARTMIDLGTACGRKVSAMITDMNEPLGMAIGNALEVKEAIHTLKGEGPKDFTELCLYSGASLLAEAGLAADVAEGRKKMQQVIDDGSALAKLKELIIAQGGDGSVTDDPERLPQAAHITALKAEKSGYIHQATALSLGRLAMQIGAGRATKEDTIDPGAGIVLNKKTGDSVEAGEVLAWVHHNCELSKAWTQECLAAFEIREVPAGEKQLIYNYLH